MNAKTLTAAMTLALSLTTLAPAAFASSPATARVDHIVDLPTVHVRPDGALQAELLANAPRVEHIVTLETVHVRGDRSEIDPIAALRERVVDLATVYVRPTAEQVAERAMIVATEQALALAETMATQVAMPVAAGGVAAHVRSVQP